MISIGEIIAGLTGAWRLAQLDPRAMSWFDTSIKGYWRSFFAAVLCLPAYIIITGVDLAQTPVAASELRIVAVHIIAYVIRWTALPLAMVSVTRMLNREANYMAFVVARNWSSVLTVILFLPIITIADFSPSTMAVLSLTVTALALAYQWVVARAALAISGPQALVIVGLDLLIDLLLISATRVLLPAAPV